LHLTLGLILEWISYFQDQRPLHNDALYERQLFWIVDDLCRFILHEVVHIGGEFVHLEHELSTDPKYAGLRQWENQNLRAGTSSVTQRKLCLYSTYFYDECTLMMHVMILLYDFMLNL